MSPRSRAALQVALFWAMREQWPAHLLLRVLELTLASRVPLAKTAAAAVLRRTALPVFFGGETLDETIITARSLLATGDGAMFDFAAPEQAAEPATVVVELGRIIDAAGRLADENPGLRSLIGVAVKVSTLATPSQLRTLADDPDGPAWKKLLGQVTELTRRASERHVPLYLDAEQTWLNPVIERLAARLLRDELPLRVTVQAYLRNLDDQVNRWLTLAESLPKGHLGIKLVRGAYIADPTERAAIWPEKPQTDAAYDRALTRLSQSDRLSAICVATHNQNSIRLAAGLQATAASPLFAASLYGMGGALDLGGLRRSWYLPFPGASGLPGAVAYFGRRAAEFLSAEEPGGQTRGALELAAAWRALFGLASTDDQPRLR